MFHATILGGGMMGQVMAQDLARDADFEVTLFERSPERVEALKSIPGIQVVCANLDQAQEIRAAVKDADVVLGALPSHLGLMATEAVIRAEKPYADIAFMADDPRHLDALAKEKGVTVIYDFGVAPGVTNILSAFELSRFDRLDQLRLFVGGLPLKPTWPYNYKAPFAPADVLEEYTRPARLVVNGKEVVRPALSDPEILHFEGFGEIEAFNTDGLRSLVDLPVQYMSEKTLRYPGHSDLMRVFRETGLFSKELVELEDGQRIRPLDLTQSLLFPKWKYEPEEEDATLFRVDATGMIDGEEVHIRHEMIDRYDRETKTTSMGRTTAFPCAIAARWLAKKTLEAPGVHPPEAIGAEMWPALKEALAQRGVHIRERTIK